MSISIHAPRVGCDTPSRCLRVRVKYFNPRTPRGVRPYSAVDSTFTAAFQSTHPAWGATSCGNFSVSSSTFQSTHPAWGATQAVLQDAKLRAISIHAPRVGCDAAFSVLFNCTVAISIHAPRVGCDRQACDVHHVIFNFNPRTPRGVRPCRDLFPKRKQLFQSTHPAWGATAFYFLITVEFWGFQSTHPAWGATDDGALVHLQYDISIHAPRVGCDSGPFQSFHCSLYFNPRTPRGVRRIGGGVSGGIWIFQSTHPAWGATAISRRRRFHRRNFNPRTPRGVRRPGDSTTAIANNFNPRTPRGVRRSSICTRGSREIISIHAPRVGCD